MVENFGSVFYLIIFIINLAGLGYYTYLTYLNPKQLISDYELGNDSIALVRVVGSFVLPYFIIGIIILFKGVEGAWIYFVSGLLISSLQLIYDLGARMKIFDNNYKVINKNSDTIIAVLFIVINVILINGLSDKIYM
tara:strand:+ start:865 stop:1275 length:411 start_codon:yes stop_codon:yes gene_type:complete